MLNESFFVMIGCVFLEEQQEERWQIDTYIGPTLRWINFPVLLLHIHCEIQIFCSLSQIKIEVCFIASFFKTKQIKNTISIPSIKLLCFTPQYVFFIKLS